MQFAFRDGEEGIRRSETTLLEFLDRDILRYFYDRQYASEGYTRLKDQPFRRQLHDYKKTRPWRLSERYISSGGCALDVGGGRSLFSETEAAFPSSVVVGDLAYVGVQTRAGEMPEQRWAVFASAERR
jgi:hypothetical protein